MIFYVMLINTITEIGIFWRTSLLIICIKFDFDIPDAFVADIILHNFSWSSVIDINNVVYPLRYYDVSTLQWR